MTIALRFIDRIKLLYRNLSKGVACALDRTRSYEIKVVPSALQTGKPRTYLPELVPIRLGARSTLKRLPSRNAQLSWGSLRSSRDAEHTRSNLG